MFYGSHLMKIMTVLSILEMLIINQSNYSTIGCSRWVLKKEMDPLELLIFLPVKVAIILVYLRLPYPLL